MKATHEAVQVNAVNTGSFLSSEAEKSAFPNICKFLSAYTPGVHAPAAIDAVHFHADRPPGFARDVKDLAAPPTGPAGTASLFIIEGIDPATAQHLLDQRAGPQRASFLQFLDDFLDDHPSYSFDDIQNHYPPRQSATAHQRHESFHSVSLREFDRPFALDNQILRAAVQANRQSWKSEAHHGPLTPVQRTNFGMTTAFPPCVLSRNHFAAWFDGDVGSTWSIGTLFWLTFSFFSREPLITLCRLRAGRPPSSS